MLWDGADSGAVHGLEASAGRGSSPSTVIVVRIVVALHGQTEGDPSLCASLFFHAAPYLGSASLLWHTYLKHETAWNLLPSKAHGLRHRLDSTWSSIYLPAFVIFISF
jgi:hypothetical protein